MGMTEDKAKEILDFLAKKFGYDGIQLYKHNDFWTNVFGNKLFYIRCITHSNYTNNVTDASFLYGKSGVAIMVPNLYDEALKQLIEISSAGEEITNSNRSKVFLPAYSSLEEILIEMDLENGIR